MSDLKELLDREARLVDAAPEALESVLHRRDRKRRNQRIAAGMVGIAVFVAAIWIVTSVSSLDRSETSVIPGGNVTGPAETPPPPLVEPVPIGTVTRSGAGCELEIAAEPIPLGPGRLTVVNGTNRWVSFELWRLRSRSSFAQLEAFVEAYDADGFWPIVPGPGGVSLPGPGGVSFEGRAAPGLLLHRGWFERKVGPGASGTITDNFATGDVFAVVCLDRSSPEPLGQPYTPFAVVGPIVVP
jgi:hypothetical protein